MRLERRPPGMSLSRIARRTLSVVALCSAASIWSAPTALADVTDVTVIPGLSNGPACYGSGCMYLVVARTSTLIERSVSIVDYNGASTFRITTHRSSSATRFRSGPPPRPENTPSWRIRHLLAGPSRPSP
jgi:hypothetical protein